MHCNGLVALQAQSGARHADNFHSRAFGGPAAHDLVEAERQRFGLHRRELPDLHHNGPYPTQPLRSYCLVDDLADTLGQRHLMHCGLDPRAQ